MTANIYLGSNQAAFNSGKKWDLAIVDPPFGIGAENHAGKKENGWTQWEKKDWDNSIPDKQYFDNLFLAAKNQIVWGGNYMTEYLPSSMCWLIWDKGQRDFSLADGEMAWTSFDKAMRIFTYARAKANQEDKIHQTQKPVALYKWLLKNYAKEGDSILDTHGGSMSSVIACIDMGFDIDVWELDPDYYKAARKRIENHIQQLPIFGPPPIINFHD